MMNFAALQMCPPSPKWIENRSTYLGGADIAAIAGVHPYKTALGVYLEKTGFKPAAEPTQAMVHGRNLKVYIARCYRRLTGRRVHRSRFYRDRDVPFFAVNPDYEVRGERPLRLVQCKTTGYFAGQAFGDEADAVPDHYFVQCMWQVAITGRSVCDLAVLIGGQDLRIYSISRDEESDRIPSR